MKFLKNLFYKWGFIPFILIGTFLFIKFGEINMESSVRSLLETLLLTILSTSLIYVTISLLFVIRFQKGINYFRDPFALIPLDPWLSNYEYDSHITKIWFFCHKGIIYLGSSIIGFALFGAFIGIFFVFIWVSFVGLISLVLTDIIPYGNFNDNFRLVGKSSPTEPIVLLLGLFAIIFICWLISKIFQFKSVASTILTFIGIYLIISPFIKYKYFFISDLEIYIKIIGSILIFTSAYLINKVSSMKSNLKEVDEVENEKVDIS